MMIWFFSEDCKWFSENTYQWWRKFLPNNSNSQFHKNEKYIQCENNYLLLFPSREDIIKFLREGLSFDVLSYNLPPPDIARIFTVHYLENAFQYLTTQENLYLEYIKDVKEKEKFQRKKLEEKLGLKIYQPIINPEDMIGLTGIKRFIYRVKLIQDNSLKAKGIFLVGVPGTGKSFSAKYAASLLNYYLVELNVAKVIESENPVEMLHQIFRYIEELSRIQNKGIVLWIDEIEKMFAGMHSDTSAKRIFGQLLTILNDLNTETGYQINGIFWVTANNIKDIVENNPEFLRKGRFDELFFVDTPDIEDAKKMFSLYKKKFDFQYLQYRFLTFEEDITDLIQTIYSIETSKYGAKDITKFIYTPAEIENIVKEISIRYILKENLKENLKKFQSSNIELIKLLYSKREFNYIFNYIKKAPYFHENYETFLQNIAEYISKTTQKIDFVDIIYVIVKNDPLIIRLRESISYMRSQEKFFTPAE